MPRPPVNSDASSRPIVICPLEFERQTLARLGFERRFRLVCSGPGRLGIERCMRGLGERATPVILAGLAGGLDPDLRAGVAHVVREVVDDSGLSLFPNFGFAHEIECADSHIVITSVDKIVATPGRKELLRRKTGAALVDLESCTFARIAEEQSRRWAIVRGVSDDATVPLPRSINEWTDAHGRTRMGRVVIGMLGSPRFVRSLMRLRTDAMKALRDVARLLESIDEDLLQKPARLGRSTEAVPRPPSPHPGS